MGSTPDSIEYLTPCPPPPPYSWVHYERLLEDAVNFYRSGGENADEDAKRNGNGNGKGTKKPIGLSFMTTHSFAVERLEGDYGTRVREYAEREDSLLEKCRRTVRQRGSVEQGRGLRWCSIDSRCSAWCGGVVCPSESGEHPTSDCLRTETRSPPRGGDVQVDELWCRQSAVKTQMGTHGDERQQPKAAAAADGLVAHAQPQKAERKSCSQKAAFRAFLVSTDDVQVCTLHQD